VVSCDRPSAEAVLLQAMGGVKVGDAEINGAIERFGGLILLKHHFLPTALRRVIVGVDYLYENPQYRT
jgi:hypothetical protein